MENQEAHNRLVLIASPSAAFGDFVKNLLKTLHSFNYISLDNLEKFIEAPPEMAENPHFLVIDGTVGTEACSEWIQTVKMSYQCPVIVLHDSSVSLDFAILKKNGANQIIHKNFDQEFILDLILESVPMDWGKEIPVQALNSISTKELHSDMELNFDLFIHLPGNHKTILITRKGSAVDSKTVKKFEDSQQHLYVKKNETKQFLEYARTAATMRDEEAPETTTEKLLKSKRVIFEIMSQFFDGSSTDFQQGRTIFESCKKIINEYQLLKKYTPSEAFSYLVYLTNNPRTIYNDAINISAFAALLGHCLELPENQIESLALAGLLHNIGLSAVSNFDLESDPQLLSTPDLVQYKKYPETSVFMVKTKKVPLPPEVSNTILEHRENCDGSGFPKNLKGGDISDLGKILGLAVRIQELTSLVKGASRVQGSNVIQYLKDEFLGGKSPHEIGLLSKIEKATKAPAKAA